MSAPSRFSEQDMNRIREAVREAEVRISGEIVPVFVERSGHYSIANYKGAVIGAALFFASVILFDRFFPELALYDPFLIFLLVTVGGMLGAVLPHWIPGLKRLLVSRAQRDHAARTRAESIFLEQEVFNTRHRTGIMLFVSFFEHEVIVMADRGITKVVEQRDWDNVVKLITSGIPEGKVIDGMIQAIRRCSEILLEKGFARTADDVNELRDDLRVE